jgi:predicted lipoprotein with Yx(FWY)xxD motif
VHKKVALGLAAIGRQCSRKVLAATLCAVFVAGLTGGESSTAASVSVTVRAIRVPGLGRIIADGAGYALYAYMPDDGGPSKCFGKCARQWPPLELPAGTKRLKAGRGVDAALLGTDRRPGGARQVTYDGWPLYTYVDDARGQVNGQADDMGAWYVLSTNGAVDRTPVAGAGN